MRYLFLFFLLSTTVFAQSSMLVSNYDTSINFGPEGSTHVRGDIEIQNTVETLVIPGSTSATLSRSERAKIWIIPIGPKRQRPVMVNNLLIKDLSGRVLESEVSYTDTESIIEYEIWAPIKPGENYKLVMEFDTPDLISSGILFYTGVVPKVASSIPIEETSFDTTKEEEFRPLVPLLLLGGANREVGSNEVILIGYKSRLAGVLSDIAFLAVVLGALFLILRKGKIGKGKAGIAKKAGGKKGKGRTRAKR